MRRLKIKSAIAEKEGLKDQNKIQRKTASLKEIFFKMIVLHTPFYPQKNDGKITTLVFQSTCGKDDLCLGVSLLVAYLGTRRMSRQLKEEFGFKNSNCFSF